MSKNKQNRNVRVMAENNGNKEGFNIYLEFSGQRQYLMHHRHNGMLYRMLKDGLAVDDMRYWKPKQKAMVRVGKRGASQLYEVVTYLVDVIEDYLKEHAVQD